MKCDLCEEQEARHKVIVVDLDGVVEDQGVFCDDCTKELHPLELMGQLNKVKE